MKMQSDEPKKVTAPPKKAVRTASADNTSTTPSTRSKSDSKRGPDNQKPKVVHVQNPKKARAPTSIPTPTGSITVSKKSNDSPPAIRVAKTGNATSSYRVAESGGGESPKKASKPKLPPSSTTQASTPTKIAVRTPEAPPAVAKTLVSIKTAAKTSTTAVAPPGAPGKKQGNVLYILNDYHSTNFVNL